MYEIDKLPASLDIGYVGEKNFRSVEIDMTAWVQVIPTGVPSIVFIRPGETADDAYVATTTFENNILTWVIHNSDVAKDGTGIAQIYFEKQNGEVVEERGKSTVVAVRVNESLGEPSSEVPAPQTSWLEQMTELKTATVDAKTAAETAREGAETAQTNAEAAETGAGNAQSAAETAQGKAEDAQEKAEAAQSAAEDARDQIYAMSATASTLPSGSPATASYASGVLSFGIPKGDKGDRGDPGAGVPVGGAGGQILTKATDADYDVTWASAPDPTGKADKVEDATAGNFAGLDATGNLTDSGSKASDFLTEHQDISGKADKVSSATNGNFAGLDSNGNLTDSGHKHSDYLTSHQDISGKADKVESATSGDFAGLDANGNLTDSGKTSASFVASNQGSQNAGKALGIANDGSVTPVPFSGEDFTGATASTAGTHGYVPAPSAGYQEYYLKGDGTWADPPGGKLYVVDLDTVTNTSGSYTHTTSISGVTADMKPVKIELSNPAAFLSTVNVTTADGSITLTCSSVEGTSTVKVSLMFIATSDSLTSSEFDVLAGRIGTLSSLTTSAKTDTVAAINEVNANVGTLSSLHTTDKTSLVAATNEVSDQIGDLSNLGTSEKSSVVGSINELVGNRVKKLTFSVNANETKSITNLPSRYMLFANGWSTSQLGIWVGTGYGATATRHILKEITGNSSLSVSVTVGSSVYGLNITNSNSSSTNFTLIDAG